MEIMAKRLILTFPDDAYEGCVDAFSVGYQPYVPNPEYESDPQTQPLQIANPITREQYAQQQVMLMIGHKWREHKIQLERAVAERAIEQAVEARLNEVVATSNVTVEDSE